jgi:predicted nuclease of predicted toxin-antitoxin system
LRFLLDVHIAKSIAAALRSRGHDVLQAADQHGLCSDDEILALAAHEERILVTEDRDFSDLIYLQGRTPPPAILYLRTGPAHQPKMVERVMLVLANSLIEGHMVVVEQANIRLRPFPAKSANDG